MMVLHIIVQWLAVLLMMTTNSQFMPPPSFPYPFQQGQPGAQMMHNMPNGSPAMQMPNGGHMMQPASGGPMMQMPNGAQLMQMPQGPIMMPHLPRLPGMSANPMQMPMPLPMNGGRLPMVIMPHHSKKADRPRRKKRKPKRKRINMESSSSEDSCSESVDYRRSRNKVKSSLRKSNKREVLTPVVSYVTKDGYVVYQKKIKKDKARDWLEMTKGDDDRHDSRQFKDKIKIRDHDH
ncbi:hypothetical protein PYW08_016154 [Mythimna loreyi]|uniref:Uncharacterized protein n=1 Tax=Mythimna loreyi TaxID=667449 RepID=A0ACC2QTA3_9NEOP|nr:hypothetical protein PYW08_016154 [Mythimna loreyi]